MSRSVLVLSKLIALGGMAVAALAQTPAASSHAAVEKQIVASERAINEAIAKGDMKAFHSNIASDAVGVDPTGIMKVNAPDFDKMLLGTKIQSWNIDGSQFYWIGDATVVHMYRWTGKGTYEGQPVPSPCGLTKVENGSPSSTKSRPPFQPLPLRLQQNQRLRLQERSRRRE